MFRVVIFGGQLYRKEHSVRLSTNNNNFKQQEKFTLQVLEPSASAYVPNGHDVHAGAPNKL
jgi:hypothetical protein